MLPPQLYEHLMVFWPAIMVIIIIPLIVISLWTALLIPGGSSVIGAIWLYLLISVFSSTAYTTPQNWIGRSIYKTIGPSLETLGWKIKDYSGFDHNRQAIYVWLPHSHFGIVPFTVIAGGLGEHIWRRPTLLCTAPPFFDLPAIRQVSMSFGLVRSDYDNMKGALKQGTSLVVLPGGVREVVHSKANTMTLIKGRKGFIKLALDTGLPIIPVMAFGENEFFERPEKEADGWLHAAARTLGGGIQPPNMESIKSWFKRPIDPVTIHIGRPFECDPGLTATDKQIQSWEHHVDLLYKRIRPSSYTSKINWV